MGRKAGLCSLEAAREGKMEHAVPREAAQEAGLEEGPGPSNAGTAGTLGTWRWGKSRRESLTLTV